MKGALGALSETSKILPSTQSAPEKTPLRVTVGDKAQAEVSD